MLDQLAADLKDGRWRPLPARRVLIPKPGREELRPLSIPTVRDRVVQAATKIVLEPIFEADFLPCSFGFRPKRAAHDALQVLTDQAWRGRRWTVETDVANCFEAIPHSRLMPAVEERISDRRILKLCADVARRGDGGGGAPPQPGRYSAGRCCLARPLQRLPAPALKGRPNSKRHNARIARGVRRYWRTRYEDLRPPLPPGAPSSMLAKLRELEDAGRRGDLEEASTSSRSHSLRAPRARASVLVAGEAGSRLGSPIEDR